MSRKTTCLLLIIITSVLICLQTYSCDGKEIVKSASKEGLKDIPVALNKQELCRLIAKSLDAGDRELSVRIRSFNEKQYNILELVSDISEYAVHDGWYLGGWSYRIDSKTGILRITDIDYYKSPLSN